MPGAAAFTRQDRIDRRRDVDGPASTRLSRAEETRSSGESSRTVMMSSPDRPKRTQTTIFPARSGLGVSERRRDVERVVAAVAGEDVVPLAPLCRGAALRLSGSARTDTT